jgi:hypothetical protein
MKKSLHPLYLEWAIHHLIAIDDCIKSLDMFSNLNLMDTIEAIKRERQSLMEKDENYVVADRIIKTIQASHKIVVREN